MEKELLKKKKKGKTVTKKSVLCPLLFLSGSWRDYLPKMSWSFMLFAKKLHLMKARIFVFFSSSLMNPDIFSFVWGKVSLCSWIWHYTCLVAQAGLELLIFLLPWLSQCWDYKVCTTSPEFWLFPKPLPYFFPPSFLYASLLPLSIPNIIN
jgi:hypothetical protein